MKYILRIILAPVIAAMAITIRILGWLLQLSAMLFGIAGTVIGLLGILTLISVSVSRFWSVHWAFQWRQHGCWDSSNI